MTAEGGAIDTHVHLLPGIDDGPGSMDESVTLARALVADGVATAVATPHLRADYPGVVPDELDGRCEELRSALRGEDVQLEVVAGAEVDVLWASEASDIALRLASYGQRGDYLLVETPYTSLSRHFDELLFELSVRGFSLVLAHPERNEAFQTDRGWAERLTERGILLQVTAASLVQSSPSGRAARAMVAAGHAHLIASDAHGVERYGRVLLSAGERVARELAPDRASWMVRAGPAALLAGQALQPPPTGARTTPWTRLFRRGR
jgi:protein-tyrosine phosphatase